MSCDNVITVQDLETDKKHSTFYREAITGKAGGLSTGANIDYATNAVTGQVQKTLPKILDDLDWSYVGKFADGVTFTDKTDFAVDAVGTQWIYAGSDPFPKTVPPATVPSAPDYQVVHFGSLQALSGLTEPSLLDGVYQRIVNNLADLVAYDGGSLGGYIRVKNSYGVDHIRVLEVDDDGTGVLTAGGLHANLLITTPKTVYASQLFINTGVATSFLYTRLPEKIAAEGITNIVLDTGDLVVSGALPGIYGSVTFSGSGRLIVNTLANMLQRYPSEKTDSKKYHGKLNVGKIFGQASQAAIRRKDIRIVLFGDSISASADYDSTTIPSGFRPSYGVDNYERNNCLGASIFNEIVASLPSDVRVRFYSRAIAGRAYADIATAWDTLNATVFNGREQATAGKAWRDCVIDLNPDLVIHSMGMNETPKTYIKDFVEQWKNYTDTRQVAYSFDQAILTTPNPNYINDGVSGDFTSYDLNASKFFVAHLQRTMAKKYGYSLIDVAFNSTLKRYGFDPRSTNFSAVSQPILYSDGSTSKVLNPATAETLFQGDTPIYQSATFYISGGASSDTAGFDFRFQFGDALIQLAIGNITIYPAGTLNVGGVIQTKSVPYVLPANTQTKFTITILPTSIYVYVNNVLTISFDNVLLTATLPVRANNNSNAFVTSVYNMSYYGSQFARYGQDSITDGDYYGNLDFTTNPNGGGINHPSSTMLAEIYIPPVREFLSDLINSHNEHNMVLGGTTANGAVFVGRISRTARNRVTVSEYASGFNFVLTMSADASTYTVNSNNAAGFTVYIDVTDLSVFIKNTTIGLYQFAYAGEWSVKRPVNLGNITPRGIAVPAA